MLHEKKSRQQLISKIMYMIATIYKILSVQRGTEYKKLTVTTT